MDKQYKDLGFRLEAKYSKTIQVAGAKCDHNLNKNSCIICSPVCICTTERAMPCPRCPRSQVGNHFPKETIFKKIIKS
jgi:hypothetical protein